MRFDDKLDTVFAQPAGDQAEMAAAWAQIVDILAQDRGAISEDKRALALERLAGWRPRIHVDRRRASARSLIGRPIPTDVVIFFGQDVAKVAASLLAQVHLSEDDWDSVIPALMPASRAIVRERRDLSARTLRALSGFGLSDFGLSEFGQGGNEGTAHSAAAPNEAPPQDMSNQIKDLVARIEAFRRERADAPVTNRHVRIEPAPDHFRFETGMDGIINWVEGAPRGAIIGIEVSSMAEIGGHGVDGHAAGAFRRRTPFRNARLAVPGDGPVSGEWLISGLPCFNDTDGRFFGYRCTARRPQHDERPIARHLTLFGNNLPADSVRQLIHELRTPLNAIRGFAEMISGQLLGPVSASYRAKADGIVAEAAKLLSLFEDLDSAARLERGGPEMRAGAVCDVSDVLHSIAGDCVALSNDRKVRLRLETAPNLPDVAVDAVTVHRVTSRLLSTVIGLSAAGEIISASLSTGRGHIVFAIDRPMVMTGQSERDLLDPTYGPAGDWPDAPALGLGFTLRLISNTARAVGGKLVIDDDSFCLWLPTAAGKLGSNRERG